MTPGPITDRLRSGTKWILLVLVHSNLFISAAATSVAITTMLLLELSIDRFALTVVFLATLLVYTVNRLTDLEEDEQNVPGRASFVKQYGRYGLTAGAAGYALVVVAAFARSVPGAPLLLLPPLVAVAYSTLRLKQVFLVKNLAVGAAWGAIPLGVGVYYGVPYTREVFALAGYVTAMLTIAAVIFDIKDIEGDRAEGIETIPVRIGPVRTRWLSGIANLCVAAVVVAAAGVGPLPTTYLALLALNAYVGCYVPFATRDRSPLFYGFVVDGEHLFLAICVVFLEAFV